MKWAAKRLGRRTRSLAIRASHEDETLDFFDRSGLEEALSGNASSLRCFTFEPSPIWPYEDGSKYCKDPEFQVFQGWVLEQTQRIKVLQIPHNAPCLGALATRLQHLKHLEMEAQPFIEGVTQNGGQVLPSLVTLCLRQGDKMIQGHVNVLGCQRLKHLAVEGKWVQAAVHDPNCQLGLDANGLALTLFPSKPLGAGGQSLEATTGSVGAHTLPSAEADVETLRVTWPLPRDKHTNPKLNEEKFNFADLEAIVGSCMPIHPQPLRNLKALSLAMQSKYHHPRHCYLPRDLPHLEELVIYGASYVVFEDPLALFTTLKIFYMYGFSVSTNMYGYPVTANMYTVTLPTNHIDDGDMSKVSDSLARRGLLLDKAYQYRSDRVIQCMYLRAHTAEALSTHACHDLVNKLATQCRCRACFSCLREAGCLIY